MAQSLRFILRGVGVLSLFLALAFYFQWSFATTLWPWNDYYSNLSGLSYAFLAAVAAATAATLIWIGLSGKVGAAVLGALDVAVLHVGIAHFLFQSYAANPNSSRLLIGGIALAIGVLLDLVVYLVARRFPDPNPRPLPPIIRSSFAICAIVLLLVGLACVVKLPNILPWTVSMEASVVYGWVFLGAAVFFMHAILRPSWHNATGQLVGFLAYDLFLLVPRLNLFPDVLPERRISLIVYTLVVVYSGLLAIYYLFINRATRLIGTAPTESSPHFRAT